MSEPTKKIVFQPRYIVVIVVLALTIYVILPQIGEFKTSWRLLREPAYQWVLAAIIMTLFTYLAGAATYFWLVSKRIQYRELVLIQFAAMFINRLLPAGIGALGINYVYLRQKKHNRAEAAGVVAANSLCGLLGHALLFTIVIIVSFFTATEIRFQSSEIASYAKYIGLAIILAVVVGLILFKTKVSKVLRGLHIQIQMYKKRPTRLLKALLSSASLTLFNVGSFYCCAVALNADLSLLAAFLVFSAGVGAGAATPTPGGLGGFEAGLVAGMVLYQINSPLALAVALLYRLISYWLALIVGSLAFMVCQRRKLLFG